LRRFTLTIFALLPLGLLLSTALAVFSGMKVDPSSLRVVTSGYSYRDQPVEHGWYVQVQRGLGKRHAIVHHASDRFMNSYRERRTAEQVLPAWVSTQFPDSTLFQGERLRRIHMPAAGQRQCFAAKRNLTAEESSFRRTISFPPAGQPLPVRCRFTVINCAACRCGRYGRAC